MTDEEVLKLTVPDQLCENLDMVIVSKPAVYMYVNTSAATVFKPKPKTAGFKVEPS